MFGDEGLRMEGRKLLERRWRRALFILGIWTLFGVFLTSQSTLAFSRREHPFSWQRILLAEMGFAYIWAILPPPVLWLARRFPLERGRLARNLGTHIFASVVIGFATRAVRDLVFIYFVLAYDGTMPPAELFSKLFFNVY